MKIGTGEVGMRVNHRRSPGATTIPGAMDIIGHEVEVIHIFGHSFDIKSLQVVLVYC